MKKIALLLLICSSALAENSSLNLQLPSTGTTYGQDSIRSSDGLDCKNAIGGATNLEFGMTGIVDNYESPFGGSNPDGINSTRDVGVYARIVIPLDAPRERINCNSLYQLELRKKRLEVLELEARIKLLESGKGFEN